MKKIWQGLLIAASFSVLIPASALAKDGAKKAAAPVAVSAQSASTASASMKAELLDLNSASKKELSNLPKIGDVRSDAIIKGRPYKGKDELLSRKILTEDVYKGIKDLVIAKQKPAAKK
ncbi:MAG: helix-hairpin-helix domain-containing protein [Burkholderiales bacterium]|nr:helix-hairpin-helix domain-containing protein [Burkholderiales bacterium]